MYRIVAQLFFLLIVLNKRVSLFVLSLRRVTSMIRRAGIEDNGTGRQTRQNTPIEIIELFFAIFYIIEINKMLIAKLN
ncbi:hypothetical protein HMPREF1981_01915 [Bacteroides pyogenes F0041]|uniref:Uncharacterized protein n=1 Tax=Bacteroides pyogenes F0041 TaxID=1321819 RepID=U2DUE9_9BACE|nr:hypothetical protein [Bacteroides pyogenes]ERI85252.1 hypothetical protein HMPREF1981_01915 [Bacteroides pyogenes F0041]MBB3893882.1 hypothetical protein [Bacteroides pyogenes]GAE24068.1 hypothetical protein JCM10003_3948 [Bacteroides pyogenes JCM 10003]SUV33915.1 Uncharacterised protein [Bacteroides pyogenes]